MDYGSILIFLPATLYFFYSFFKRQKNIYLVFGIISWYGLIYFGKHNIYQFLEGPTKIVINIATLFIIMVIFSLYFKKLSKKENGNNKDKKDVEDKRRKKNKK